MSTTHAITIAWVLGWSALMIALAIWALFDELGQR